MHQFICESDLGEINASGELACGVLTPWRVDASGRKWFRRELPPLKNAVIKGVTEPRCTIGSEPAAIKSDASEIEYEFIEMEGDDE